MRSGTCLAPLLAALAGCVGEPETAPEDNPGAEDQVPCRLCAPGATVRGIDVSHHNETIDWDRLTAPDANVRFAFIRATQGTRILDRTFERNWSEARRVGLRRGAYHYFQPEEDATAQADLFLARIGVLDPGDLDPVLDVEADGGQSPEAILAAMEKWVDRVEAQSGRRVIVYTGVFFWNRRLRGSSAFADHPLWVPNYGVPCPLMPFGWDRWSIWQSSESARIPGIPTDVDIDWYNGTEEALVAAFTRPGGDCTADAGCRGDDALSASCGAAACSAVGSSCANGATGPSCRFPACPLVGTQDLCLERILVHCQEGAVSFEQCPTGFSCRAPEGVPRCLVPECPASGAATLCVGGKIAACQDGGATFTSCPTRQSCQVVDGAPRCVVPACPASGSATVCVDRQVARCTDGLATFESCPAGNVCSVAGGTAACAPAPPPPPPMQYPMCGG